MIAEAAKGVVVSGLTYCWIRRTVHMAVRGGGVNVPKVSNPIGVNVRVGGKRPSMTYVASGGQVGVVRSRGLPTGPCFCCISKHVLMCYMLSEPITLKIKTMPYRQNCSRCRPHNGVSIALQFITRNLLRLCFAREGSWKVAPHPWQGHSAVMLCVKRGKCHESRAKTILLATYSGLIPPPFLCV